MTNAPAASSPLATKADIARLEGRIGTRIETLAAQVTTQIKMLTGLVAGLYVGLALLFVNHLAG